MRIGVVIPCYKAKSKILEVLAGLGPEVNDIIVVDDACPENTGNFVRQNCKDLRVKVHVLNENSGVGGATVAGLKLAYRAGSEIIVKIDSDNQMDPRLIPGFTDVIAQQKADYAKGNRFFSPRSLQGMPLLRIAGNAGLSFLNKLATGYWQVMDPTNGFFAIHRNLLPFLDLDRLEKRYFFESDLLFRLGSIRALVTDIPIWSRYADEKSGLSELRALFTFPPKLLKRTMKRLVYRYLLRDFNIATVLFLIGSLLIFFGLIFGSYQWVAAVDEARTASSGTVMVAALPTLLGIQMWLSAILYDVTSGPQQTLYPSLALLIGDEQNFP